MNSTEDRFLGDLPDDPRLVQAVQEYLTELEAGRAPKRQEFLGRYPDLVEPLGQCLDGLELVHKATVRTGPSISSGAGLGGLDLSDPVPANPLGDFQIIRELGRGGMGVVYEALQLSLGRRVALKVLPFAATFDARHLQRFHNEAQAAAQLHHSNIVPVYAVGCERGVHFYAMQLIEGQSLATVIRDIKAQAKVAHAESDNTGPRQSTDWFRPQEAAGPEIIRGPGMGQDRLRESPSPESGASDYLRPGHHEVHETVSPLSLTLTTQRSSKHNKFFSTLVRLLLQAAEAVEYAHQVGIVHRDIKPANLLIDGNNRLWITDFGLAQFHADAGLTQTGDILGTLRYMSPEQASGQKVLDHRTDVYSLGATLYELVTLEPIFPGRNRQQLLHQIINEEPVRPRTLVRNLPIELDTIILKAVSKNPADRYSSAQGLAGDLQRYLDDKPILAKPPSLLERTRKWSRRHPSVVVASLLILAASVVGLLASNWLIAREQAKTQEALKNEKERALQARQAVDLLVDIAESELPDQPHLQAARKRLLKSALAYYGDFIKSQVSDLAAQEELEASKTRAAKLLDELSTMEGMNLIGLANNPDVQQHLNVSQSQRDRLRQLRDRFFDPGIRNFKSFGEHRVDSPDDRARKYEFAKAQEAELKAILELSQLARLRQLELQEQGPRAFRDSRAVDILKLNQEQVRQIRQFWNDAMKAMVDLPPDDETAWNSGKHRTRMDKIMRSEMESILAVLTPEQKAQWQELTGPAFEGALRPQPPPHRGGPRDGPPFRGGPPRGPKPPPDDR